MADSKITALTALTAADPINDMLPIVDVSDTTMAASGTTKKISVNNILSSSPTASGALTVTGLVTAGSATITGDLTVRTTKLAVTSTGVGCGTATPALPFVVSNAGAQGFEINPNGTLIAGGVDILSYNRSTSLYKGIGFGAESYLFKVGTASVTDAMTLNSTGLGIGDAPATNSRLTIGTTNATGFQYALRTTGITTGRCQIYLNNTSGDFIGGIESSVAGTSITGTAAYSSYVGTSTANPFHIATNGSVKATVDSSGNVGIGVTPSSWGGSYKALQLQSVARSIASTGAGVGDLTVAFNAIYDSTDSRWEYAGTGDKAGRYSQTGSGNHRWFVSNTAGTAGNEITDFASAAMTLDASGNLLVGKTANYGAGETNTLQLKSSVIFASDNTANAANRNWSIGTNASAAGNMEWTIGSTNTGWPNFAYRMQITSAGDVNNTTGTYGTISDLRLKENISDARNYLADLLKLRVVKYSLKEESSAVATKLGFIAQEVEQVFPNLVDQSDKEYEGAEGIRSVKTSILIPMLLKAIQELTARVQTLEAR